MTTEECVSYMSFCQNDEVFSICDQLFNKTTTHFGACLLTRRAHFLRFVIIICIVVLIIYTQVLTVLGHYLYSFFFYSILFFFNTSLYTLF